MLLEISVYASSIPKGRLLVFALAGLFIAMAPSVGSSLARRNTVRARVHFLARGTAFRTTWGINQDIYLAELIPRHTEQDATRQLIRIVDEYTSFAPPLEQQVLTSEQGATLRLRRDSGCDLAYAQMTLRSAPGDLLAILPIPLNYHPPLTVVPAPGTMLSCYRVVR